MRPLRARPQSARNMKKPPESWAAFSIKHNLHVYALTAAAAILNEAQTRVEGLEALLPSTGRGLVHSSRIRWLLVRPALCIQLSSDSISRRIP